MPKNKKIKRDPNYKQDPINAEQAKKFLRSLNWLNRILDALIEILESQIRSGERITPGTVDMINLAINFKFRGIYDGFNTWFPESRKHFVVWYKAFSKINKELTLAKNLSQNKEECQAALGRAERAKIRLVQLFPEFLDVEFYKWFHHLFLLDLLIERLKDALRNSTITQEQLIEEIILIRSTIDWIKGVADDAEPDNPNGQGEEIRVTLENMEDRCQFLLDQVSRRLWLVDRLNDSRRIIRILNQLRTQKHDSVRRLGEFGGKSILDFYKLLFDLDYYINNAADLWVDGKPLPEWDSEQVTKIIRKVEAKEIQFINLFPKYLGIEIFWYFDHLYEMDVNFELAKDLLNAGQKREALQALRKAKIHKHQIERVLETH